MGDYYVKGDLIKVEVATVDATDVDAQVLTLSGAVPGFNAIWTLNPDRYLSVGITPKFNALIEGPGRFVPGEAEITGLGGGEFGIIFYGYSAEVPEIQPGDTVSLVLSSSDLPENETIASEVKGTDLDVPFDLNFGAVDWQVFLVENNRNELFELTIFAKSVFKPATTEMKVWRGMFSMCQDNTDAYVPAGGVPTLEVVHASGGLASASASVAIASSGEPTVTCVSVDGIPVGWKMQVQKVRGTNINWAVDTWVGSGGGA